MNQSKYANGNPIQIDELSKKEKKQAITEWSEGNPELKKLLEYCDENGIKTWASCSGHDAELKKKAKSAYISMILEYGNSDKVLKLLAKMNQDMKFLSEFVNAHDVSCYVTICSPEEKYNEEFFKQINQEFVEIDNGAVIPEIKLEQYKDLKGIAEKESDYNGRYIELFQNDSSNIFVNLWDDESLFMQNISEKEVVNYNEKLNEYVRKKEEKEENLLTEPYLTLETVNQDISEVKRKVRRSRIPITSIENVSKNIKSMLINQKRKISNNTTRSYNDILSILSLLEQKYLDLIPKELIKYFKDNSDKNYFSNIKSNKPIREQNLSEETEALLCLLTINYWTNGNEKKEFIENFNKNEEELKNKYKINYFWEEQ